MKHVNAILWKQIKDTLKNKEILIQFVMFPVITIIMEMAIEIKGMPEHYFANLFATMYLGMAPLTAMAAVISEEKEKNTLRVLVMSNVKPMEYLLGTGIYIWGICMIGSVVIGAAGGYEGKQFMCFMLIMAAGNLISLLVGALIGTWSRTQMMATSLTVPVMLVFAFLPMLSMFNEGIAKVAKYTYTGQIHLLINQMEHIQVEAQTAGIIMVNLLAAVVLFVIAYRKKGLE